MSIRRALFLVDDDYRSIGGLSATFSPGAGWAMNAPNGTTPGYPAIITITNGFDAPAEISFDGVNPHVYLRAGERRILNFARAGLTARPQMWTRRAGIAPTTGTLSLEIIRAR